MQAWGGTPADSWPSFGYLAKRVRETEQCSWKQRRKEGADSLTYRDTYSRRDMADTSAKCSNILAAIPSNPMKIRGLSLDLMGSPPKYLNIPPKCPPSPIANMYLGRLTNQPRKEEPKVKSHSIKKVTNSRKPQTIVLCWNSLAVITTTCGIDLKRRKRGDQQYWSSVIVKSLENLNTNKVYTPLEDKRLQDLQRSARA